MNDLLNRMSNDLLLVPHQLLHLARSAPYRYKVYSIAKRKGGERTIAQPAKAVKRMQYWVMEHVLSALPVHDSATAYQKGSSILHNASVHKDTGYILKVDFKEFFPSLRAGDFIACLEENGLMIEHSKEDIDLLCRILFWRRDKGSELELSIGAPSSPMVSNVLLFGFDETMAAFCAANPVNYTRYADDIAFSMEDAAMRCTIMAHLDATISELPFPRLTINNSKTFFGSKAGCRRVTGLVLTNDGRVSLGRGRKRLIRAMIHRHVKGELAEKESSYLRGLLAFANSIEPECVLRMKTHYGDISF